MTGAGGETRTLNIQIRSLTLYPVELRPHTEKRREDFIENFVGRRKNWGERRGLNPRPLESQSRALPAELRPPCQLHQRFGDFPILGGKPFVCIRLPIPKILALSLPLIRSPVHYHFFQFPLA